MALSIRSSDLERERTKKCRSALRSGLVQTSFWRDVLCQRGCERDDRLDAPVSLRFVYTEGDGCSRNHHCAGPPT